MKQTSSAEGFTLIELLVTVVILAIGLLGMAGLQTTGLNSNQSAYHRSQATIAIADLIDRMRANPTGLEDGNYGANFASNAGSTPTAPGCINADGGCTPAEIATFDQFQWSNNFFTGPNAILPNAVGSYTRDPSTRIVTVTITWEEMEWGDKGLRDESNNKTMTVNAFL